MKVLPLGVALGLLVPLGAQDPMRLKADVVALTAPDMGGRASGTPGQARAAAFVARRFKRLGLKAFPAQGGAMPYLQPYDLVQTRLVPEGTHLIWGARTLTLGRDFEASAPHGLAGPLVPFGEPCAGSWVFLPLTGSADAGWLASQVRKAREGHALGLLLAAEDPDHPTPLLEERLAALAAARQEARSGSHRLPLVILRPEAQRALGLPGGPLPEGPLKLEVQTEKLVLKASNVLGFLPGRDPHLAREYVIVSAHHDHLGSPGGVLHPGADDNASGTSALLEVARLLRRTSLKRSVLFLSVSGEELGLHGSRAFLDHPPVPVDRLVADLNIDMIGRPPDGKPSITPARVEGAVGTLTARARELAGDLGLALRDEADTYWRRSDHYSFAQRGIPAVFLFGGMHEDYHQPTDTADKLDYPAMARVVALVTRLARDTAEAEVRPSLLPSSVWAAWPWPSPVPASR